MSSGIRRPATSRGRSRELVLFQVLAALAFGFCALLAVFMYWLAPLLSR